MNPCEHIELLLYDRAAEALAPEDAPRLEEHLATCVACREELARIEEALDLAKLPSAPPSASAARGEGDQVSLARMEPLTSSLSADLASSTLALWNRRRRRRVTVVALAAGALAAAAAGTLALAPALYSPGRRAPEPAASAPAWSPDVDGAWEASAFLDPDADEDATIEDAALAGLDATER